MQPIIQDNGKVLERLARLADEVFLMRQARNRHLPTDLVGEPAWDILLALYRHDSSAAVSDLCEWSNLPESTAGRWVVVLQRRGFLSRSQSTHNHSAMLSLTPDGRRAVERSLEAMLLVARR